MIDWYNENWGYRKAVIVDNTNNASALTDYQVRIDVTYNSNMLHDFADIRFTDSDGKSLISHWQESYVDSSSAIFWVEVPNILGSSEKTIYMYYGNSGASDVSGGVNTFEFFDDFSEGWPHVIIGGTYEEDIVQLPNGDILLAHTDVTGDYIKIAKSKDNGDSFTYLSTVISSDNTYTPKLIQLTNGDLFIIYVDWDQSHKMLYKKSTDDGATWGGEQTLESGTCTEINLVQTLSGRIIVAWTNYTASPKELRLKYSDNNGTTWSDSVLIDTTTYTFEGKSFVQTQNGDVLLSAEEEEVEQGHALIKQWRSVDDGVNWGSSSTIWDSGGDADVEEGIYVKISDSEIWYITSTDEDDVHTSYAYANAKIKRIKSTDNGNSWGDKKTIKESRGACNVEAIKLNTGEIYIIYNDYVWGSSDKIFGFRCSILDIENDNVKINKDWDIVNKEGYSKYWRVESNELHFTAVDTSFLNNQLKSKSNVGKNIVVRTRQKLYGSNYYQFGTSFRIQADDERYTHTQTSWYSPDRDYLRWQTTVDYESFAYANRTLSTNWFILDIIASENSLKTKVDGSLYVDASDSRINADGKIGLGSQYKGDEDSDSVDIDWILVRKYSDPEPSTSFGEEEPIPVKVFGSMLGVNF